jgi:hypothetical protein
MLRPRYTVAVALLALACGAPPAAHAANCAGADVVPAADNLAVVSQATLCLVNDQRTSHGLRPLSENRALTGASAAYSQRMVQQAFFAHESPDGGTLVSRLTAVRYLNGGDDWVVGENIGWGQGPLATPRSMVIGLGFALGTPPDSTWGATYTTDFGDRGGAPAKAAAHKKRRKAVVRAACARSAQARKRSASAKRSHARRVSKTCARLALL